MAAARQRYVPTVPVARTYRYPELVAQEYDALPIAEQTDGADAGLIKRCFRNRDRDNGTRAANGEKTLGSEV